MRITGGQLAGRQIEAPHGHRTHPMGDKVRAALFNTLGDVSGLEILDAFAGSGALAIEALSREAKSAVAIDVDKRAVVAITKNASAAGLAGKLKVVKANVSSWSNRNTDLLFDLVVCDPPYDKIQLTLLEKLASHTKSGGVVVYSLPPQIKLSLPQSQYQQLAIKEYGDAQLLFYRRIL